MLDVTIVYAITTPLATETASPSPTSTLTPSPPFPETPPILDGMATTLYNGDIWLVEPGLHPEALTASGDVTAIFGWNRDGSKLLFRRRSNSQSGLEGGTTQLWILDMNTRKANRLASGDGVKSASWSPVDDQIAYCTRSDVLSIITLDEVLLHQLKQVVCDFTWSPDGMAIAVYAYTPDMIASDGLKYTVIGVWRPAEDRLQVFSDAKEEDHSQAVWSLDGKRVMFVLMYYEPGKQELSGLHVLDVASEQIQRIESDESSFKLEIRRSPRADLVAYRMDGGIYMTDFEGQSNLIDQGNAPLWLPDGKTLLYRAVDASFQTFSVEAQVAKSPAGGNQPATGVIIDPEYYLSPGGKP